MQKKIIKKLILFILLMLISTNNLTYACPNTISFRKILTIQEALNIAIEQQTLTQRIAKIFLALNNNISEPKFYPERDEAIETFQTNIDILKSYIPSDKIKNAIHNVRKLWEEYKEIANWSINRISAKKIVYLCDEILDASTQLVNAYEDYAKELNILNKTNMITDSLKISKIIGIQKMLPQRIMFLYLSAKQDIDSEECIKKLDAIGNDFSLALDNLAKIKNNPLILKEITETRKYWETLRNYLKYFNEDPIHINSMLFLSDELTKKAGKLFELILAPIE